MRPDPDEARTWLESELARPEYHQQGLVDRFYAWLDHLWLRLTLAASDAGGLSTVIAVVLALLVVAVVLMVVPRVRRTPGSRAERRPVLGGEQVTADQHRARAEAALAEGRPAEAVVEAMRALARRMVDRGVLEETPCSTAHEIAFTVAEAFPSERGRLVVAAQVFDAVQYGGAAATPEQATALLALHDDLRAARPAPVPARGGTAEAVPR